MKNLSKTEYATLRKGNEYAEPIIEDMKFKTTTFEHYNKLTDYIKRQHNIIFNNYIAKYGDKQNLQAVDSRLVKTFKYPNDYKLNDSSKAIDKLSKIHQNLYHLYCKKQLFN